MITPIMPKNDNQIPSLDDNENYKNNLELTELLQKTSTDIQEYVSSLNPPIINTILPLKNVFESAIPKISGDPEGDDGAWIKK